MIRTPPRPTLFPYTTLFRSTTLPDGAYYLKITALDAPSNPPAAALTTERESERFEVDNTPPVVEDLRVGPPSGKMSGGRSEEHTSELQSHSDLVCRLLLEKK